MEWIFTPRKNLLLKYCHWRCGCYGKNRKKVRQFTSCTAGSKVNDPNEPQELKKRAEALKRVKCSDADSGMKPNCDYRVNFHSNSQVVSNNLGSDMNRSENDGIDFQSIVNVECDTDLVCSTVLLPPKRRNCSFIDQMLVTQDPKSCDDEVSRYKPVHNFQFGLNQRNFLSDPFSTICLWHSRRNTYSRLYKIAL